MQNTSARLTRWVVRLQAYSYTPIYIKGHTNILPDYLSWNPDTEGNLITAIQHDFVDLELLSNENILRHQDKDGFCTAMKSLLLNGKEPLEHFKHLLKDVDNFDLDESNNLLIRYYRAQQEYRKNELKIIPVIPKPLEGEILQMSHATSRVKDMREAKTIGRIKGNFYFPKMYSKVKTFIQGCLECAKQKSLPKTPKAKIGQYPTPSGVGELMSIDIWGAGKGLPVSRKGNRCVLYILDNFNSYLYAFPIKDQKESTIVKVLVNRLFLEHEIFPRILLSDNSPCFRTKLLDEIADYLGIKRWYNSSYMAAANEKIERKHRELSYIVGIHVWHVNKNLDNDLPFVFFAVNAAFSRFFKRNAIFYNI
jgi:hypothetical protein